MPCPGLGSHPLTTGVEHLCQQLPSALIRVTKWSQTQGLLCPTASCAHTTPQQCQHRGGSCPRLDVCPGAVQGSGAIHRAKRSPDSCVVVTVNSNLWVFKEGRSSASLWSPCKLQGRRETEESCF